MSLESTIKELQDAATAATDEISHLRAERDRAIEREAVMRGALHVTQSALFKAGINAKCDCPSDGHFLCTACEVKKARATVESALSPNAGAGMIEALREIAANVPDEPMAYIIELSRIRDIAKRALAGVGE